MIEITDVCTRVRLCVVFLKPSGLTHEEVAVQIDFADPPIDARRPEGAELGAFFYAYRSTTTLTIDGREESYRSGWLKRGAPYYVSPETVTAEIAAEYPHLPFVARRVADGERLVRCRGGWIYAFESGGQVIMR